MSKRRGLVIGGNGALGSSVITAFHKNWEMTSLDFSENKEAHKNIIVNPADDGEKHLQLANEKLSGKYDMILCAAGGWCQGSIESDNIFSQFELSLHSNLYSSLLASHIATTHITEMGLLIFVGSLLSFKENTPSMLSYGVTKNMVHSLALNMSTRKALSTENIVLCILPEILNTEVNRKAMPKEDHSKWVSPKKLAETIFDWARGVNTPKNGSFVAFKAGKDFTQEYL